MALCSHSEVVWMRVEWPVTHLRWIEGYSKPAEIWSSEESRTLYSLGAARDELAKTLSIRYVPPISGGERLYCVECRNCKHRRRGVDGLKRSEAEVGSV